MKSVMNCCRRLHVWCFFAVLLLMPVALVADVQPPNIVVIVADDMGWADVSYHGSPIATPNIDRLVRDGVELDRFYVAPMCTPTRAALLSGRYWSRFGNTAPSNTQVFPFETMTLAAVLKSVGYDTGITGKWHLGSLPKWGPRKFGFNRSHGSLAGGVGPWNHRYKQGQYTQTWHRNDELIDEEGHVTDLITAEAIRFIETPREKPFFLYVPYTAVHHPLDEPKQWLQRGRKADPQRGQYAACTMHMDDCIGRLIGTLDRTDQRDDTLIVFFSDNGGNINAADADAARYPGKYPQGEPLGKNTPLRGRKTQVYEGGIRVPACVCWPKQLKPHKVKTPLHVIDWMPTLSQLAGYKPDRDLKWDGRDIWPILTGKVSESDSRVLYWQGVGRRSAAIRDGDWKLVVHRTNPADRIELFNLADDPNEQHDRSQKHPDRVARLQDLLSQQVARDGDAVVGR